MAKLLSSYDLFLRAPSSNGLISLIRDLANERIVLDDAKRESLETAVFERGVSANHSDFLKFDIDFWDAIRQLDLSLSWKTLRSGKASDISDADPIDDVSDPLRLSVEKLIEAVKTDEEKKVTLLSELNPKDEFEFPFFSLTTSLASDSKLPEEFTERISELDQYFSSFILKHSEPPKSARSSPLSVQIDERNWGWIAASILQIYSKEISLSFLLSSLEYFLKDKDKDEILEYRQVFEEEINKIIAEKSSPSLDDGSAENPPSNDNGSPQKLPENQSYSREEISLRAITCLIHGALIFVTTKISGCGLNVTQQYKQLVEVIFGRNTDNPIFRVLDDAAFSDYLQLADEPDLNIDDAVQILADGLWRTDALRYSKLCAWDFLVRCWLRRAHEEHVDSFMDVEPFSLVDVLAATGRDIEQNDLCDFVALFGEELCEETFHALMTRHSVSDTLSPELAIFIIKYVPEYAAVDDSVRDFFAQWLGSHCAQKESEGAGPVSLQITSKVSEIGAVACGLPWSLSEDEGYLLAPNGHYFSSIATAALNFNDLFVCANIRDREDSYFSDKDYSRGIVQVVRQLARQGLREHAAVLLSYSMALGLIFFGKDDSRVTPVKEIDAIILHDLDEESVKKYVVPILLRVERMENVSLTVNLWACSLVRRFSLDNKSVLKIVEPDIRERSRIEMPDWFNGGSERLDSALQQAHQALKEPYLSQQEWLMLSRRYNVHDAISELLRQLEAQLQLWFSAAYVVFRDNKRVLSSYNESVTSRHFLECRSDGPDWGWIERLLRGLAEGFKVPQADREQRLIAELDREIQGFSNVLGNVSNNRRLVDGLGQARRLDNKLSHNEPLKRTAHRANPRGVVPRRMISLADAKWAFHYVTVDFSDLYAALEPLITSSD